MKKYRIVKVGDTESYLVQQRYLKFFWKTRMGSVSRVSLKEAREYVKMFEADDLFEEKRRARNTVVE